MVTVANDNHRMSTPESPSKPSTPSRPLIREPRLAPVIGDDAHLPAVAPERLTPEAVRVRFAPTLHALARTAADGAAQEAAAWTPEFTGDGQRLAGRALRPAAVLVPLVRRPAGLTVLLTRRTDHLNDHAGQVSFPGGRTDPEDADAVATALREAQEEVGIAPEEVEVIGRLPTYTTVTAYEVTPVVGLLDPPRALALDAFEVAEVFEVPLAFLMDPANHRRHAVEWDGLARQFISMPWGEDARGEPYFVWGATAAMLRNLYRFLAH
jgi:8-oxo-dGTP pyrophosphatase MutT (NUDIX family)